MFIEGRLKTRKWNDATGNPRQATEVIVDNFIFLDPRAEEEGESDDVTLAHDPIPAPFDHDVSLVSADNHPSF